MQAKRNTQSFLQPDIDYSPWSPIEAADLPLEVKTNKARSIESSAQEPIEGSNTPNSRHPNNKIRTQVIPKGLRRRNFQASTESVEQKPDVKVSTYRPPLKRRPTTSTTVASTSVKEKPENVTRRVKGANKIIPKTSSTTPKPKRQFTARSTSDNVLVTTSEPLLSTKASFKRVPFTRGNFRPKTTEKIIDGNASEDDNYPEHFKLLLKSKEVTDVNDKAVLKKPLKPFRPSSVNKTTKSTIRTVSKGNVLTAQKPRAFVRASTSTEVSSSSEALPVTTRRSFRRPRPTERLKAKVGTTLQEPPTAKSTSSYPTRSSAKQLQVEETVNVNTQADAAKQIDPPLREYFPRTSAVSSRFIKFNLIRTSINCRLAHH